MNVRFRSRRDELAEILNESLLQLTMDITFPWVPNSRLDGSEVGDTFFRQDSHRLWNTPATKSALVKLSNLGLDAVRPEEIVEVIRAQVEAGKLQSEKLQFFEKLCGALVLLDQGPRNLFEGINARYTYHYFDVLALSLALYLLTLPPNENVFSFMAWAEAGFDLNHATLRVSMLMAPLCHSEDPEIQQLHLNVTEAYRSEYESLTDTNDPHRETKKNDLDNIYLMAELLDCGPPRGKGVTMSDFVYWIMRYFTSHVAYISKFSRSPFRNVAVGRNDGDGEVAWLRTYGVIWTKNDEDVRQRVRLDQDANKWTPLNL